MIIFEWLESWMANDNFNFNVFVGLTMLIVVASLAVQYVFLKKIGSDDERTSVIKLRINSSMYTSLLFILALYVLWVPSGTIFFRQYLVMGISLSILVGAIFTVYYYRKQFSPS